jgi:hypothetical protein
MSIYDNFNSVFFLSLATLVIGSVGVCLATCIKSKCTSCKFSWINGIEIIRDVEAENQAEEMELQHETPSTPALNDKNRRSSYTQAQDTTV